MDMDKIIDEMAVGRDVEFGREFGGLGFGRGGRNPNRRMKNSSNSKNDIEDVECDDLPCSTSLPTTGPLAKEGKKKDKKMKNDEKDGKKKGGKKKKAEYGKEVHKLTKDEERRLFAPQFDAYDGVTEEVERYRPDRR
jgi:hypothetical protein